MLLKKAAEAYVVEHSEKDVDKGNLIHYSKLAIINFLTA